MLGRNATDIICYMAFTLNPNQNYIRIKKYCFETHYQVLRINTGPTTTSGERETFIVLSKIRFF